MISNFVCYTKINEIADSASIFIQSDRISSSVALKLVAIKITVRSVYERTAGPLNLMEC